MVASLGRSHKFAGRLYSSVQAWSVSPIRRQTVLDTFQAWRVAPFDRVRQRWVTMTFCYWRPIRSLHALYVSAVESMYFPSEKILGTCIIGWRFYVPASRAGLVMGGNPVAQLVFGLEGQVRPSCAPRRCRALSRSRQEIIDLGVGKNSFKLLGLRR